MTILIGTSGFSTKDWVGPDKEVPITAIRFEYAFGYAFEYARENV